MKSLTSNQARPFTSFETDSAGTLLLDVLHIVARTRSTPHHYYYRTVPAGGRWTPWKRIDLDIQGDNLVAVVNDRLPYLFWAEISTTADEPASPAATFTQQGGTWTGSSTGGPARTREMRLAWSALHQAVWAPKRVSDNAITQLPYSDVLERIFLTASLGGDQVTLVVSYDDESARSDLRLRVDARGDFRFTPSSGTIDIHADSGSFIWDAVVAPVLYVYQAFSVAATWTRFDVSTTVRGTALSNVTDPQRLVVGWDPRMYPYPKPREVVGAWPLSPGLFAEFGPRSFVVSVAPSATTATPALSRPLVRRDAPIDRPAVSSAGAGRATDAETASRHRESPLAQATAAASSQQVQFNLFYHPYVKLLLRELDKGGPAAMMSRTVQTSPETLVATPALDFTTYQPTSLVAQPYPTENVDFAFTGAYSTYNWELFFYIPLTVARGLMTNRRFDDARRWLQLIFDPTDQSSNKTPQKYWQMGALFNYQNTLPDPSLAHLLDLLVEPNADPSQRSAAEQQVAAWRAQPFDSDVIARLRLSAYQKAVVMTYGL